MTQPTEQDRPMGAIEDMLLKFTSGNDVAVQRAVITLDEWRATYAEYMALQARVAELEAICESVPEGCTGKALAKRKADAVREACDKVVSDYRAVSFDKNDNLYLNIIALRDYAGQIEREGGV